MKASLVNRLFDGWVSEDDLKTIDILCSSISSQDEGQLLRRIVDKRTLDVTDLGQRNQVRMIANRWLTNY